MKSRYLATCLLMSIPSAYAAENLNLPDQPLQIQQAAAPLIMLVMGRDHTLYYEAYNDASDLNSDGIVDTDFMPSFKYFGLFDPNKCYTYDEGNAKFSPDSWATDGNLRKCAGKWSGNFLNYLTTARIDALRKVLYGGLRSTDSEDGTTLIRSYIPQDDHSWGKVWDPAKPHSYALSDYTPLANTTSTIYHFANTSMFSPDTTDEHKKYSDGKDITPKTIDPLLRIVSFDNSSTTAPRKPWSWAGKASIVADKRIVANDETTLWWICNTGEDCGTAPRITNFAVKVDVCVPGKIIDTTRENANEEGCFEYNENNTRANKSGRYKPVGILQKYGVNNTPKFKFGLITGSYEKNLSGGVLRKKISKLGGNTNSDLDEIISSTGQFNSGVNGIISTLNKLRIADFTYKWDRINYATQTDFTWTSHKYQDRAGNYKSKNNNPTGDYEETGDDAVNCGWITDGPITDGQCKDWGNPIGEMLFESLRYFAGENAPSTSYVYGASSRDAALGLPLDSWDDPFASPTPWCSPAYNLVISTQNLSYDSDQLPGSKFTGKPSTYSGTTTKVSAFNATSSAQDISTKEASFTGKTFYIGESLSGATATTIGGKSAPLPKTVSDLASIRGLAPQEPTKQGSFYSAAVSYFANNFDRFTDTDKPGKQGIKTLAVALSAPLPEIKIDTNGDKIPDFTLIPFAKSVASHNGVGKAISTGENDFQPTASIVDFYVESMAADGKSGTFRVNFEDVEQGADHDMDVIATYAYSVDANNNLTVTLTHVMSEASIELHIGYIISGTDRDGIYLDIRSSNRGPNNNEIYPDNKYVKYYLDTLPDADEKPYPNNKRTKNSDQRVLTSGTVTRTFAKGSGAAAQFLKPPLWYAVRWGNYDVNTSGSEPTSAASSTDPNGYYLVSNAGDLQTQLENALSVIKKGTLAANSLAFTSKMLAASSVVYNSSFDLQYWDGELSAYQVNAAGTVSSTALWNASEKMANQSAESRNIFTAAYVWNAANSKYTFSQRTFTAPTSLAGDTSGLTEEQIALLLNNPDLPQGLDDTAKKNYAAALVNYLRGNQTYETSDAPGINKRFRTRRKLLGTIVHSTPVYAKSGSTPFIITGANDGMVHVFNASGADAGKEIFGYVPTPVYRNLAAYSRSNYGHKFYVDGGINVKTVQDGNTTKVIAVGSLGQGGQGIYALDLTSLDGVTAASNVKWEFTDKNDVDMGYYSAAPSIVQMKFKKGNDTEATERWVAVFGNGYNNMEADGSASTTGNAVIYIVDLLDGTLIKKLDSGVGTSATSAPYKSNAMAQPLLISSSNGSLADRIYAGDLFGNMWKFDVSSIEPGNWKSALLDGTTSIPFYKTGTGQAITTQPTSLRFANGSQLLMFGTGKYLEIADKTVDNSTVTQSIYAVKDSNQTATITKSTLVEQKIIEQNVNNIPTRTSTNTSVDWNSNNGWYMDLIDQNANTRPTPTNMGERVIINPWSAGDSLYMTTFIPANDSCSAGGDSWSIKFTATTGAIQSAEKTKEITGSEPVVIITGTPPDPPTPGNPAPPLTAEQQQQIAQSAGQCKNNGLGNTMLYLFTKKADGSIEKIPADTLCNGLVSWQEVY